MEAGKESLREEAGKESLSDSEGSDFSFNVSTKYNFGKIPTTKLKINGVVQTIMIDSGATINVMDEKMYEFVKDSSVLEKSNAKLYPYGSTTPLPLLGKIKAEISTNKKSINDIFYVVKNSSGCLLSFSTAKKLEIINIVNTVKSKKGHTLIDEFDCLFKGLGKQKNFQLKLNIDDTVQPVHQKHRRISFSTRDKVKMEIDQLYKEDICEDVGNDPTPWVSPIVVVPKTNPNKVRICVDMRAANEAIKRVKHPMPTLDELIHDLNGCKVFSKLDLNQAYHQIELHPESRYITTFSTHLGLHRYKRLNYGVNAASEKFQKIIEDTLSGLEGVRHISDDIIVASENEIEHEKHLRACLQRLKDKGLTLQKEKCVFFQTSIDFFGNVFSSEGISPHSSKVNALQQASRPTDKSQVQSLLGLVNYVQRYISNVATLVKPLRNLTKKNANFSVE